MNKLPLTLRDTPIYSKTYAAFRGCDFTSDKADVDDSRSPDSLNMIADDAGFPEKRVGWRILSTFSGTINGLHYIQFPNMTGPVIIVHHGTNLTAFNPTTLEKKLISETVHDAPSSAFAHKNYLYILDGQTFYRLDNDDGYRLLPVSSVAKTPTTGRGGHYEAKVEKGENDEDVTVYTWTPCTSYEEPNLLSSEQVNLIAGDGVNTDFWLTERGATITKVETYTVSGWAVMSGGYTASEDTTAGKTKVTFSTAPSAHPAGAGFDNIRITFTSTEHPADLNAINKCSIATQYGYFNDNRFFVAGNPDKKNRDWACAIDDPTYWEINQWTDVGSDQTAIVGYLHYGNVLAIVKEDDNQDAEIYIRSATVQSDNSVLFPVQQGVKGVGAISRGVFVSLRDDPMFYAREGVFAISGTDASQQRTIQNRSYFVDNKLREEFGKSNAVGTVWGNLFLIAFPSSGHCYVADGRQQTRHNESWVYEWFYWENVPACRFLEYDGNLFFGTTDGKLCRFNSDMKSSIKYNDSMTRRSGYTGNVESRAWTVGTPIMAKWTTRADELGVMAKLKTMTKRGCVCVLKPVSKGCVDIYVTTDGTSDAHVQSSAMSGWDFADVDFGNFYFGGMGTPQIVPLNSKVKKFQMLQIAFENNNKSESFGVNGVQIQFVVNNYIK